MTTIPPHNEDVEKSIIWLMVTYPEEDFSQITPDDFYSSHYSTLSKVIIKMKESWEKIDMITLFDNIKKESINISVQEITELWTWLWTVASLPQYIKTLKDYKRKREAIKIWNEIIQLSNWDPSLMVSLATKLQLASTIWIEWESSISYDDVNSAYEQIASRYWKSMYGFSWGSDFWFLDSITKWLQKKRVYRIGAPSNTWKTQLIYNLIPSLLDQVNEEGKSLKVAFFTLENTKEDTLVSIMCNKFWLNSDKLNKWEVEWNWDYLTSLKDRLYIIDDVYELSNIFSKIISIKPDVVILDYITHVIVNWASWLEKYDVYAEKVPKFTKLRDLVWIDLSNLPKNLQTNEDIRMIPWFYWSSILMNNCDVAIHLMKNETFKKTKDEFLKKMWTKLEDKQYFYTRACLDLLITKNRWGSVFVQNTYWLNFDNWGKWKELSEDDLNRLWAKYW